MRVIIPMAGRGTRLRPHTLTIPKPLLPVAGKPIVQRLVEDIAKIYGGQIDEIVYIIGDFGAETERLLLDVATRLGAKGRITYQDKPLGTAHAINCAGESLDGELIIAFADTLFRADFQLDRSKDGVIWVKTVEDPRPFGVVTVDSQGIITGMVEKPQEFVSDLAIIGIYYIKDGKALANEIKHLLDNDIRTKGEYQLTDALESLRRKGAKFVPGKVDDWMDCGNKESLLATNASVLGYVQQEEALVDPSAVLKSVQLIPPVFVGKNAHIEHAVLGPNVSVGDNSHIQYSVISEAIVQANAKIANACLADSIVGNNATVLRMPQEVNIGDYCNG